MKPATTIVSDIGVERLCVKCGEFWPVDDVFWYFQVRRGVRRVMGHCKACWSDRDRSKYGKQAAA